MKSKVKSEIKPELTDSQGRVYWIEEISIDSLNYWDSPTQIPTRYDGGAADEYAARMKNNQWDWQRTESYPVVFKEVLELESDGKSIGQRIDFWIGDGHHTIEAGEKADRETLPCRIYLGNRLDAKLYSFREANRYHGVRLTNQQKREIVNETLCDRLLLSRICENVPGSTTDDVPSERLIASYLGEVVSAPTVGSIWDQMVESGRAEKCAWLKTEKRLGLDGKRQIKRMKQPIVTSEDEVLSEKSIPVKSKSSITLDDDQSVEMNLSIEAQNAEKIEDFVPECAESVESTEDAQDGFEFVTLAEIKDISEEHSIQIAQIISQSYAIDDLDKLQQTIYRSILKTLTDYRDEILTP